MKFSEKTVIVTGASQGIGRSICLEFAKEGAECVVAGYSNLERTQQVANEIESLGGRALGITADVSKNEDVSAIRCVTSIDVDSLSREYRLAMKREPKSNKPTDTTLET